MPLTSYKIGTTVLGLQYLESLTQPVRPPRFTYQPYSKQLTLGDGSVRGGGYPWATWHWDLLGAKERDQLRTFCSGASAWIYIQTRVNTNTTTPTPAIDIYKVFYALMIWPNPEGERDMGGYHKDFEIKFQAMVVQP
jgi:hypothetical protein